MSKKSRLDAYKLEQQLLRLIALQLQQQEQARDRNLPNPPIVLP